MRKRIVAMLTAVLVALCLAPQAAMAEGTTAKVADETELLAALADENVGAIVLADDITLASTGLDISRALTLDLGGHALSVTGYVMESQEGGQMMMSCSVLIEANGDLSLVNSSESNGVLITTQRVPVYGTLRIAEKATFKIGDILDLRRDHYADATSGVLYMDGGNIDAGKFWVNGQSTVYANAGQISACDDWDITVYGAIIASDDLAVSGSGTVIQTENKLQLRDGEISCGTYGCKVQVQHDTEVSGGQFNEVVENGGTISGGTFNGGLTNQYEDHGIHYGTISGGTFNGEVAGAYTITFDSDGGTEVAKQVRAKAAVTKPEDPVKKGYVFLGWYNGSTAYDFTEELPAETGTLTLTAKWAEDAEAPKISGLVDGGTYHSAVTFQVSDNYKVASVAVNGEELAPNENGSYTLAPTNGKQEVVVADTAQNTVTATVTVGHHGAAATCTSRAVCEVCEAEFGELDPSNHSALEHVAAKEATTQSEGNIEYWFCSGCGKYFADEAATNEIAQEDTVIAREAEGAGSTGSTASAVSASTRKSTKGKMPATGDAQAAIAAPAAAGIALALVGVLTRKRRA